VGVTAAEHRPTLELVALRAGVSRATVSRVVNGSLTVQPETRDAVLKAVRELGYVPNAAARSLVTQRTNSMALVFPEPAARSSPAWSAGSARSWRTTTGSWC
jgi:DNA-binding LacI/PurR family transcriptional regulator